MVKYIVLLVLTSFFSHLHAATYFVGSAHTYTSPNELYQAGVVEDGDTILIEGEIYSGNASLAVWHPNQLFIKGINGTPHLMADGKYILGKGIWVFAGDNITVENIEFSGATVPDENGAGIRLDGAGVTVRHCYFHDNENGILTSNPYAGDILIEHSEFANNGFGDGFSHNLYVGHVNSLTFRYNYSHHAKVGHNLKSRANENYIYYNRIMDEASGYSSRLIDLSNGGFTIIMGNLLMQGPNAENNTLIGYGKEGLSNDSSHLYVVNNTMVNKRVASCIFVDIQDGTEVAELHNNIFAGTGTPIKGSVTATGGNVANPVIANLNFTNEANYDYHINSLSPAIDLGVVLTSVNGYSLVPDKSYNQPLNFDDRIINNGVIDAGAYEYYMLTSIPFVPNHQIIVYPNPASDYIIIDQPPASVLSIKLYDISGQLMTFVEHSNRLELTSVSTGLYILKIGHTDGSAHYKSIFKL